MNPKITKLLAEREKNSEKIAKLNARNVTPDELAALMQAARPSGPQSADPAEKEEANYEET